MELPGPRELAGKRKELSAWHTGSQTPVTQFALWHRSGNARRVLQSVKGHWKSACSGSRAHNLQSGQGNTRWVQGNPSGDGAGAAGISCACPWCATSPAPCCSHHPGDRAGGQISTQASGQQVDIKHFGLLLSPIPFSALTICLQLRHNGLAKHQPPVAAMKG